MHRTCTRIGLGIGGLLIIVASGCSSTTTTANAWQERDVYIVYSDHGVTVGDRTGMQVKAASDTAFAMALADTYPDLETTSIIGPARPVSTLADYPIVD